MDKLKLYLQYTPKNVRSILHYALLETAPRTYLGNEAITHTTSCMSTKSTKLKMKHSANMEIQLNPA